MSHNSYPNRPNQNQQGAEQAPTPLNADELKALNARVQQRLRQIDADPHGGHQLVQGEMLHIGYQDDYGQGRTVTGRFFGWTTNREGQVVPDIQRYIEPPREQQQPVQKPYPQPQVAPRPQPPYSGQNQYPQPPYPGQNQYPQPQPIQRSPQQPMYPGQQAPQPVAPPRLESQGQPPTQAYNVPESLAGPVMPEQVPEGFEFGPQTTEAETIGLGPQYRSFFEGRGANVNMNDLEGAQTHADAVEGVIGHKGAGGDDRYVTPELRQDDLAAQRAQAAAEEIARQARQQPGPDHQ